MRFFVARQLHFYRCFCLFTKFSESRLVSQAETNPALFRRDWNPQTCSEGLHFTKKNTLHLSYCVQTNLIKKFSEKKRVFFIKLNYSTSFFKVWPGLIPQIEKGHLSPDLSVVTWRTCVDFFAGFFTHFSPFFSDFSISKNTFSPLRVGYLPPPSTPVPGEHLRSQVHVLPDHHLTGVLLFLGGEIHGKSNENPMKLHQGDLTPVFFFGWNSWTCFGNPRGEMSIWRWRTN